MTIVRTEKRSDETRLSASESRILALVAQGLSNQEIADELIIAKRTVDFHLVNIYGKLHVHNRVQAILKAHRFGFLPSEGAHADFKGSPSFSTQD